MGSCLVVAGEKSGCGKTTVSLGLMKAFSLRGFKVQGFKAGPDYIDPSYYKLATGREGRNLDLWMLDEDTVLELFDRNSSGVDISIVEGAMGLFDGAYPDDKGSSAHVAKVLKAPVILVVDAGGSSTSIAATILGFKLFDSGLRIEGVILNKVGGESHLNHLRKAIEERTGIKVLGGIPRVEDIALGERHLGLIPAVEGDRLSEKIERVSTLLEKHLDLGYILKIANSSPDIPVYEKRVFIGEKREKVVRVGVAIDRAFSFYYEDNLDILRFYGCEVVFFSPTEDERLPRGLDAIFIGGGFPEVYADTLEHNRGLREEIKAFSISGKPVYAECGGLMYLGKEIETVEGKRFAMVGAIPVKTVMRGRIKALGYREVVVEKDVSFFKAGDRFRGHEFHYSELIHEREPNFAFKVIGSTGKTAKEGIFFKNTLASYTHIHLASNPNSAKKIPERIKEICRCYKKMIVED